MSESEKDAMIARHRALLIAADSYLSLLRYRYTTLPQDLRMDIDSLIGEIRKLTG